MGGVIILRRLHVFTGPPHVNANAIATFCALGVAPGATLGEKKRGMEILVTGNRNSVSRVGVAHLCAMVFIDLLILEVTEHLTSAEYCKSFLSQRQSRVIHFLS